MDSGVTTPMVPAAQYANESAAIALPATDDDTPDLAKTGGLVLGA